MHSLTCARSIRNLFSNCFWGNALILFPWVDLPGGRYCTTGWVASVIVVPGVNDNYHYHLHSSLGVLHSQKQE